MKLFLTIILLFAMDSFGQRFELYTGVSSNKDNDLGNGYMAGFNFIMDMNQREGREWANRILFGMEHSGFYSDKLPLSEGQGSYEEVFEDCDCIHTRHNLGSESKYLRKQVRGVSLNFGIEAYKGFYLLTGISTYNHISEINRSKVSQFRTTLIDFGVKYFIGVKNWFFAPTIKFNPESVSFGIGVSWNHL